VSLLIGMNFYRATGDAARRQDRAIAALRRLAGVAAVNLQWPDDAFAVEGIPTVDRLIHDSRAVTGRDGRRKPIVGEMLDLLAAEAEARGCDRFLFANGDIEITSEAAALIEETPREGWVFTRTDLDPDTHAPLKTMTFGVDAFVFDVAWWRRHRQRFRPYILGEPVWDNVYTAVLLTHSDAPFVNRVGLVLHERHDAPWRASPFNDYTWFLAALDRPYFSLWARFHAELTRLGSHLASDAVDTLRRRIFDARALRHGRTLQFARVLKARARYALQQRRAT